MRRGNPPKTVLSSNLNPFTALRILPAQSFPFWMRKIFGLTQKSDELGIPFLFPFLCRNFSWFLAKMLAKLVLAIVFLAIFKLGYGYPALPPAFAFHPSQQQLAMAAAGINPIMPVNYPGFTPMTAVMQSRNAIPMPFNALYTGGRGADSAIQQQQQKLAMLAFGQQHPYQQQLFIRNNVISWILFAYVT